MLRGALVGFGFVDLLGQLGGALEDGLVSVELWAIGAELDDEDGGSEVPMSGLVSRCRWF